MRLDSRRRTLAWIGLLLCAAPIAFSQSGGDPEFTYTLVTGSADAPDLVRGIQRTVTPAVERSGAKLYAIWTPAEKPESGAAFAGLAANQVIVMLAWPGRAASRIPMLDAAIRKVARVTGVSSRVFIPIYLADGLKVPTGGGFYVHREEHYARNNVEEAVRLSRESWRTFEPFWGTKVIGLFRESPDPPGFANLNRIAWYPSFKVWSDTRDFRKDPESAKRFEARDKLKVDGPGVAIATDRVIR